MDGVLKSQELAPGVHRVVTIEAEKYHAYHVLEGANGLVLVDPGYKNAPSEVYQSFLTDHEWDLDDVNLTVITHSDADHHGGSHELRELSPGVTLAAHAADADLMENKARILSDRYRQFEADHGIVYDDETFNWLTGMMGPDEDIDVRLTGGETLRLGDRLIKLLHTPGHSRGHLMLYDSEYDVVIGADGFFGRGLFDINGGYLQPPPYFLYPEYKNTIQLVESLDPDVLSFTHYELLEDDEITAFIHESLDFTDEMQSIAMELTESHESVTLKQAIEKVVDRRGSFGLDLDLAFPLSAHYENQVDQGRLAAIEKDGHRAYTQNHTS